MADPEPDHAALAFAKTFVEAMLAISPAHRFDAELCKAMTMISASHTPTARIVARLTVTPAMCNPGGTLHGGAICTLFDVCTTVALAMARKWEIPGVTRTLSTTCLVPVSPGEEILVEGEVAQVGKKLAHIIGKMTLVRNGKLVATGVHDKVNVETSAAMSSAVSKL